MDKLKKDFLFKSYEIGNNWKLCQATGGNTSIKHKGSIEVKASGVSLKDSLISHEEIFVDLYKNENDKKPSMEFKLHLAIPKKYIFHYHPLRFLLCSAFNDLEKLKIKLEEENIKVSILPYVEPGEPLANEIKRIIKKGDVPDIILLTSHGVVISANKIGYANKCISTLEKISFDLLSLHINNILEIEDSWDYIYKSLISEKNLILKGIDLDYLKKGLNKLRDSDILFPDQCIYLDGNFETWGASSRYFNLVPLKDNYNLIFKNLITKTQKEYLISLGFLISMIGSSKKQIKNYINEIETNNLKKNPDEIYRKKNINLKK